MDDDRILNGQCWLAYFDILGFQAQVRQFKKNYGPGQMDVLAELYQGEILGHVEKELMKKRDFAPVKFHCAHFSDNFVFFTSDDSDEAYLTIDWVGRFFFAAMIWKKIPFRGALSVGEMYADTTRGIYVGEVLIDAHKCSEKQEWIGYVMSPKVRERLAGTKFDLNSQLDYAEYDVPVKTKRRFNKTKLIAVEKERLYAHRINKYPHIEESILEMQQEAKNMYGEDYETECKDKFENTLAFVRTTRLESCSL